MYVGTSAFTPSLEVVAFEIQQPFPLLCLWRFHFDFGINQGEAFQMIPASDSKQAFPEMRSDRERWKL